VLQTASKKSQQQAFIKSRSRNNQQAGAGTISKQEQEQSASRSRNNQQAGAGTISKQEQEQSASRSRNNQQAGAGTINKQEQEQEQEQEHSPSLRGCEPQLPARAWQRCSQAPPGRCPPRSPPH